MEDIVICGYPNLIFWGKIFGLRNVYIWGKIFDVRNMDI